MKLILIHPLRSCWLWLKWLRLAAPTVAKPKPAVPADRPKAHRTTAFFELP